MPRVIEAPPSSVDRPSASCTSTQAATFTAITLHHRFHQTRCVGQKHTGKVGGFGVIRVILTFKIACNSATPQCLVCVLDLCVSM